MKFLRSIIIFVLFLTGSISPATAHASAKRIPNIEFKALNGSTQNTSSLRGSIVVISFWATWCAPCKEELPRISALSQSYAGKPVRFIAISADEQKDHAKIETYVQQQKLAMEIWTGADLDTLDRLALGNVLPATVVFDEQGEIIARIMGEAHDEDIQHAVDWILGNKAGAPPAPITKRY